jgi:hypothetical protein
MPGSIEDGQDIFHNEGTNRATEDLSSCCSSRVDRDVWLDGYVKRHQVFVGCVSLVTHAPLGKDLFKAGRDATCRPRESGKLNGTDFFFCRTANQRCWIRAGTLAYQQLDYDSIENDRAAALPRRLESVACFGIRGLPVWREYGENSGIRSPFSQNR